MTAGKRKRSGGPVKQSRLETAEVEALDARIHAEGSGKTLTFLLPVLEKLFRLRWGGMDGLGALIISPTRELALQIFDELRKVGKHQDLSAGLLIGGKNVKQEKLHINSMNIIICTPGRLLQHMDETPGFDCSQLQVLVLDEADRILDMGFSATLDAIVQNLPSPPQRQTLLFSATQTKSVKALARLSLRDPEYIAVHADAAAPTPVKLRQAYVVCELQHKTSLLWAFIKAHLSAKVLVFVSTCKQAQVLHEAFRRLRPGAPLRSLHGNQKQRKRMAIFYDFCQAKSGMVLIATDIAARGLDFPALDWVVQLDCPEDSAAYIHRVGRTARYVSEGRSLLVLLPSEAEPMKAALAAAKVALRPTSVNAIAASQQLTPAMQALLSKTPELKDLAQRAVVAYVRSVFLQPKKDVFDVRALPLEEFALSLGLPTLPRMRFLSRQSSGKAQPDSSAAQTNGHGTRMVFDADGDACSPFEGLTANIDRAREQQGAAAIDGQAGNRYAQATARLKRHDKEDQAAVQERRRERAARKKQQLRASTGQQEPAALLNVGEDSGGDTDLNETMGIVQPEASHHGMATKRVADRYQPRVQQLDLAQKEALALKLMSSRQL
ncbi:hypothetical protein WJX73_005527 [Symbiochloris irregularis]|uniref:ATP-dependent RNA helicase n=1 Tax=Symbiochloris irregularis TaxID=706552 RepID=A0AAW1P2L4_9CHLO